MTVEEAISRFTDEINGEGFYNDNAHREMAIEALEKQIPKKPIDEYHRIAYCPACGELIVDTYCCPECGQKIDWSEE